MRGGGGEAWRGDLWSCVLGWQSEKERPRASWENLCFGDMGTRGPGLVAPLAVLALLGPLWTQIMWHGPLWSLFIPQLLKAGDPQTWSWRELRSAGCLSCPAFHWSIKAVNSHYLVSWVSTICWYCGENKNLEAPWLSRIGVRDTCLKV